MTLGPDTLRDLDKALERDFGIRARAWNGVPGGMNLDAHADAWEVREMALKAALEENANLYRQLEALTEAMRMLGFEAQWLTDGRLRLEPLGEVSLRSIRAAGEER
mgnify:CR=1 FL=1